MAVTCVKMPHSHQTAMTEETAPEQPSVRSLLGSTDEEILEIAVQMYQGQYEAVPSILPCQYKEPFLAELHKDLGWYLRRAGLKKPQEHAGPYLGAEGTPMPIPCPKLSCPI